MLGVTQVWFLCDYIKLLIPESLFCSLSRMPEYKQLPFWQASRSSPFLETVIFPSCLPYLSSHSFCSIVLLSFPCFIFPFFFFLMSCNKAYAVSGSWSTDDLLWKSVLFNPSILAFNPYSLICSHLTQSSPICQKWQFCWIFENKKFLFMWLSFQLTRLLHRYFMFWPVNCKHKTPK